MNRFVKITKRIPNYRVEIPLDDCTELMVRAGEKIRKGDLLYKKFSKNIVESHYLPKQLGVLPKSSIDYLCRVEGEYITPGEVIAERLSTGGLMTKKVMSSSEGIISTQRIGIGYIDILSEEKEGKVFSDITGEIESIKTGYSLVVDVDAYLYTPFTMRSHKPAQKESPLLHSTFEVIKDGSSIYSAKDLDGSYEGKVVFAGKFAYPSLVTTLFERGCQLVVAYSMDYNDFNTISGPLALVGGFGHLKFSTELQSLFHNLQGSHVVIDFESNELCFSNLKTNTHLENDVSDSYVKPFLSIGDSVEIEDYDHFKEIAHVASFSEEHAILETYEKERLLVSKDHLCPVVGLI